MNTPMVNIWDIASTQQFAGVLAGMDSSEQLQNFLRDIMTEKEILEISSRLEAAKMLRSGKTYFEIAAQTKLSSRTIARISDWMQNGTGGYSQALNIINEHHAHIPPVRAV